MRVIFCFSRARKVMVNFSSKLCISITITLLCLTLRTIAYYDQEGRLLDSYIGINNYYQYSGARFAFVQLQFCNVSSDPKACYRVRHEGQKCASSLTFDILLQRQTALKSLFVEYDKEVAENIDALFTELLYAKREGNIYGARFVKGPGGEGLVKPKPLFDKDLKAFWALMFNEKPGDTTGYTKEHLEAMQKTYVEMQEASKRPNGYIVLDAYYLSLMEEPLDVIELKLEEANIIIYQLPGNPLPEPEKLKTNVIKRQMLKLPAVFRMFLPMDYIERVESFIPNVNWMIKPYIKQGRLARTYYASFMTQSNQLIELTAFTCESNPEYYSPDQHCEHLFLINHFWDMFTGFLVPLIDINIHQTMAGYDYANTINPVFSLLIVANGPNPNKYLKLKNVQTITKKTRAVFVLGFNERSGSRNAYNKDDFTALVAIMQHPNLESNNLGVRLRIDFLAQEENATYLEPLMELQRFKFLFMHDGMGINRNTNSTPIELNDKEVQILKRNLRIIGRETYIMATPDVRQQLQIDESIQTHSFTIPTTVLTTTTEKYVPVDPNAFFPTVEDDVGRLGVAKRVIFTGLLLTVFYFRLVITVTLKNCLS